MAAQLTLQAPTALPPGELGSYLEQLWQHDLTTSSGAATFSLVVWEGSWLEQQLVRSGKADGPITGLLNRDLLEAARSEVATCGLPLSTAPMDPRLAWALGKLPGNHQAEDLRGQFVESAISAQMPRRLITLAPTLDGAQPLQTLVAAYCPLPEDGSVGAACGDVVVLRGGIGSLQQGLHLVQPLIHPELPCWVWWNSSLDEAPEMLSALALPNSRLVVDSSLGSPRRCLDILVERIQAGQTINDLNWLRLRCWRESLAMVFDPPARRDALAQVVQLDIDVEGDHPVKGLLLAAWIADRLGWHLVSSYTVAGNGDGMDGIGAEFERSDGHSVQFRLMPVPVGAPKIHPGALVGLRLICQRSSGAPLCVILCSESGGCMRLESGGMASLAVAVLGGPRPNQRGELQRARRRGAPHDSTSPLLASAAPIAAKLLPS